MRPDLSNAEPLPSPEGFDGVASLFAVGVDELFDPAFDVVSKFVTNPHVCLIRLRARTVRLVDLDPLDAIASAVDPAGPMDLTRWHW